MYNSGIINAKIFDFGQSHFGFLLTAERPDPDAVKFLSVNIHIINIGISKLCQLGTEILRRSLSGISTGLNKPAAFRIRFYGVLIRRLLRALITDGAQRLIGFAAGILLSVGSLWLMPFASYVMQATCFFTIGFFVFGPQMLIGMAAAECSHKEAAGAATGFVGLFAYLGASLAGWPLAKVLDTWHWSGFFVVISIAAGVSALLLLPFLNAQAPREA